jgi:hypothetical protein
MTGQELREAIAKASPLNNPRLNEIDWDAVADVLSAPSPAFEAAKPAAEICGCAHGCVVPLTNRNLGAISPEGRVALCDGCYLTHTPEAPPRIPQRPVMTADWINIMGAPYTQIDVTLDTLGRKVYVDEPTLATMARTLTEAGIFTDEDAKAIADTILATPKHLNGKYAQLYDVTDSNVSWDQWLTNIDPDALEVEGLSW